MAGKDYLQKLSDEAVKKPESYQEEKVEYMQKAPLNKKKIVIGIVILAILAAIIYFIFMAPKIVMPDFVGQSKADISNWVRQEKIDATGIVIKEEYNFDNNEDIVISQDIAVGTKVKTDLTATFTISKGANPDELISFADIANMDNTEINLWIKENKLTKVSTSSLYSNTIQSGKVISYDLTSEDEDSFTRSSRLSIVISKGIAPAKTITLANLVGQTRAYVESYATTNKLDISYVEAYDEEKSVDVVLSQSVAENTKVKEGSTLTVTISKGKVVYMKNLVGMTKEEAGLWLTSNGVNSNYSQETTLRFTNEHNSGKIISQSIKAGTKIDNEDYLFIKESKGMLDLHSFTGAVYTSGSKTLIELQTWIYTQNHNGDAQMGGPSVNYVDETTACVAGNICDFVTEIGYLNVGSSITVNVAKEKTVNVEQIIITPTDLASGDTLVAFCEQNSIEYTRTWKTDSSLTDKDILSVQINEGTIYGTDKVKLGVDNDEDGNGVDDGGLSGMVVTNSDKINIIIVQN
jgi:beta-lactam-binding protein with PASTA domain